MERRVATKGPSHDLLVHAMLEALVGQIVGVFHQRLVGRGMEGLDEGGARAATGHEAFVSVELDGVLGSRKARRAEDQIADSSQLPLELEGQISLHGHENRKLAHLEAPL